LADTAAGLAAYNEGNFAEALAQFIEELKSIQRPAQESENRMLLEAYERNAELPDVSSKPGSGG
jgi:flagellar hook-basal body complex protein FliE